jgi:DNA-binding transcriptional LysR family regulator
MSRPDLSQLTTLAVLLEEGSVVRAAQRLRLSPSAMSRALARLRLTMGDPLLVRAGRELVPTPRALALREQVGRLVDEAEAVLRPSVELDPGALDRTFTIRTSEGFVETFGPALLRRIREDAPLVRLRFLPKDERDTAQLRDGSVDLETGIVRGTSGPELRAHGLFRDRFVGVARAGHPLARRPVDTAGYTGARHVVVWRRGRERGPVDRALDDRGLGRIAAAVVGGFAEAIGLARGTDLVATVPARHTEGLRAGMHSFELPFPVPEITVSLIWHPRMEADPGHRWIRSLVVDVCGSPRPARPRRAPGK